MAKAIDRDKRQEHRPRHPVMTNAGAKTARIHSSISNKGKEISETGIQDRLPLGLSHFQVLVDILDGHCRLVDKDADGQRQSAQGHDIDGLAGQL